MEKRIGIETYKTKRTYIIHINAFLEQFVWWQRLQRILQGLHLKIQKFFSNKPPVLLTVGSMQLYNHYVTQMNCTENYRFCHIMSDATVEVHLLVGFKTVDGRVVKFDWVKDTGKKKLQIKMIHALLKRINISFRCFSNFTSSGVACSISICWN